MPSRSEIQTILLDFRVDCERAEANDTNPESITSLEHCYVIAEHRIKELVSGERGKTAKQSIDCVASNEKLLIEDRGEDSSQYSEGFKEGVKKLSSMVRGCIADKLKD